MGSLCVGRTKGGMRGIIEGSERMGGGANSAGLGVGGGANSGGLGVGAGISCDSFCLFSCVVVEDCVVASVLEEGSGGVVKRSLGGTNSGLLPAGLGRGLKGKLSEGGGGGGGGSLSGRGGLSDGSLNGLFGLSGLPGLLKLPGLSGLGLS